MATASVIERRNRQIQDAIEGKNWKQALQLCERRISRGEDTLFLKVSYSVTGSEHGLSSWLIGILQAWKALILCHYDDEAHHKRGVTETLALCKLDPPVAEVEVINLLQTSLDNIPDQKQLSQSLWEKAAKRKPQDEKLQRRWYTFATGRNDWKSAQKVRP
jgi:N-terminal acetyltransferase B complex non-catalytic subunit